MSASHREQELAEYHAREPVDRALILYQSGQTLQIWGFPLEALEQYRRALEQFPGDPNLIRIVNTMTRLIAQGGAGGEDP
jgi:hypothetical protein